MRLTPRLRLHAITIRHVAYLAQEDLPAVERAIVIRPDGRVRARARGELDKGVCTPKLRVGEDADLRPAARIEERAEPLDGRIRREVPNKHPRSSGKVLTRTEEPPRSPKMQSEEAPKPCALLYN